jgi:LacI family repressor for deo operon, udp, cdd, tsx, nupC, and nupG
MTDVARAAGVSLKTVSRVINNEPNVRPELRERVTAALRVTGYQRNEVARSLVTGTTRTIALLLPNVTNPIYSELVGGVQTAAEGRGYSVLLCATQRDAAREERYFELLSTRRSDGAILVNTVSGKARITELAASGVRLVAALDSPAHIPSVPHIGFDERRAAADIVGHLLDQGHRSVAHLAGTPGTPTAKAVAAGYRAALRQAGMPYDADLVLAGDFTEEAGWHGVQHLLKTGQRFTAVFAGNDLTAIGALAALQQSGLSVPADVSVAGVDDIRFTRYTSPTLTTVHQPASEMGRRATEMLLDQLAPDSSLVSRNAVFRGQLVLRNSVGPPPDRLKLQSPCGLTAEHGDDLLVDVVLGDPLGADGEQELRPLAGLGVQHLRLVRPHGLPCLDGLAQQRVDRLGERGGWLPSPSGHRWLHSPTVDRPV